MVLQVTTANNVKVYTVSGGLGSRSIPDWLVRQKKKALKKDFGIDFGTNSDQHKPVSNFCVYRLSYKS